MCVAQGSRCWQELCCPFSHSIIISTHSSMSSHCSSPPQTTPNSSLLTWIKRTLCHFDRGDTVWISGWASPMRTSSASTSVLSTRRSMSLPEALRMTWRRQSEPLRNLTIFLDWQPPRASQRGSYMVESSFIYLAPGNLQVLKSLFKGRKENEIWTVCETLPTGIITWNRGWICRSSRNCSSEKTAAEVELEIRNWRCTELINGQIRREKKISLCGELELRKIRPRKSGKSQDIQELRKFCFEKTHRAR